MPTVKVFSIMLAKCLFYFVNFEYKIADFFAAK